MDKDNMIAAVNALKNLNALNQQIATMQSTHQGDHLTPTHTAPGGADPGIKSFYMCSASVQEQQGYTGQSGWAGPIKKFVSVPGYIPIKPGDEAAIIRGAIKAEEYLLISQDDAVGSKFLFVTGTPLPYAGFDYSIGDALPRKVPLTAIVIRPAPNAKILSVFAADSSWIDRQGGAKYSIT
jgi:hypothetical protein